MDLTEFCKKKCACRPEFAFQQLFQHCICKVFFNKSIPLSTNALSSIKGRAGRRSLGTIVLSREQTERSRTIPSFRKKNERIERVLKNIGTICKETERMKKRNENGTI